jgi:hypothetical protein
MKKVSLVARNLLVLIIALQLLNLSICSEAYWDDYDYAYSSLNSYDPTETIVEWVVEMKYGQQDIFSYNNSIEKKIIAKSFHWQTDLHQWELTGIDRCQASDFGASKLSGKIKLPTLEIVSPPPEFSDIA